jgi:ADP-ribose pyrophosphatase YjhB (NUDIX family)
MIGELHPDKPKNALPVAVAAVLSAKGILLIQRAQQPFAGLWGMPGGKVHAGEHLDEAIRRELREEAGIRTRFDGLCGVVTERLMSGRELRGHYLLLVCRLRALSVDVRPSPEGLLEWMPVPALPAFKDEIIPSDLLMLERLVLREPRQSFYRCVVAERRGAYRVKRFD